jgi:hypothetical protein
MLIRITSDMFIDKRFECLTITDVREELFQTQKFKNKYPWRLNLKNKIVTLGTTEVISDDFNLYLQTITTLIESGTINQRTQKFFNLSRVDKKFIAGALAHNYEVTTTDNDLIDFLQQEFSKSNIAPLSLINRWLRNRLIEWNEQRQSFIEDWDKCNEAPQPFSDIEEFENLTGYEYVGPK